MFSIFFHIPQNNNIIAIFKTFLVFITFQLHRIEDVDVFSITRGRHPMQPKKEFTVKIFLSVKFLKLLTSIWNQQLYFSQMSAISFNGSNAEIHQKNVIDSFFFRLSIKSINSPPRTVVPDVALTKNGI